MTVSPSIEMGGSSSSMAELAADYGQEADGELPADETAGATSDMATDVTVFDSQHKEKRNKSIQEKVRTENVCIGKSV